MKKINCILPVLLFLTYYTALAQNTKIEATESIYQNTSFYNTVTYSQKFCNKKPKNVILLIGDGMGIAQIHAGMTANRGNLFLSNFRHVGFSRTCSANRYVTDSGAGGTAIATGHKTNNSSVGVDSLKISVPSILETAQANGLATGIVVTTSILDATPAAFVAHVPQRSMMPRSPLILLKQGPRYLLVEE
jgi:alkaline phosphatase